MFSYLPDAHAWDDLQHSEVTKSLCFNFKAFVV